VNAPCYLLAEDEPLLSQMLASQLAACWPRARCLGIAANGEAALAQIEAQRPEVVFLDVRMPEMDGLEVARVLWARQLDTLVVFVTAYDQYAVDAFDAAALDYLLKPVELERLARCVQRLEERLASSRPPVTVEMASSLEALLARQVPAPRLKVVRAGAGHTVKLIPVENVLWFEAADKYVSVATVEGDSAIRTPLRELLQQLDPEVFWQVHRGTIVNSRHIAAARRNELGQFELVITGRAERLPVSRQFAHLFKQM